MKNIKTPPIALKDVLSQINSSFINIFHSKIDLKELECQGTRINEKQISINAQLFYFWLIIEMENLC